MKNKSQEIKELVRRVLIAQRELGSDELILSNYLKNEAASVINSDMIMGRSKRISTDDAILADGQAGNISVVTDAKYKNTQEHYDAICNCQLCPLGKTRNKFVYGVGNPNADLMLIGEAPGAKEDEIGEPFVGRAGQLLDKILAAIGFDRDSVYIANILKCRPPGNRDPLPEEMSKCFPYLREQVRLVKPKVVCALGRIAAQAVLNTKTPLGKLRGSWHQYEGVPLLVTYHPAALLRFPAYKKDTWADIQLLKAEYDKLRN